MSTEECNSDEDCTAINITVINIVFLIFAASSVAGSTWTWICTEIQQAAHGKRCNKCAQQDQEMLFINNSECLKAVSLPYILKHLPRQIFGFSSDFFFKLAGKITLESCKSLKVPCLKTCALLKTTSVFLSARLAPPAACAFANYKKLHKSWVLSVHKEIESVEGCPWNFTTNIKVEKSETINFSSP